jgi:hypothetical protein
VCDAAGSDLESAVLAVDSRPEVGEEMGVGCTAVVVAGEYGLEGDDAVFIGLLDTSEVRRVPAVLGFITLGDDTTAVC